jgi:hypothetical protein
MFTDYHNREYGNVYLISISLWCYFAYLSENYTIILSFFSQNDGSATWEVQYLLSAKSEENIALQG